MTEFNKVDFVRGWCYKILPLVYDDSLSYYEMLCKLKEALNEVIKNINILPDYVKEIVKEFLESGGIEEIIKEVLSSLYFINVKNPPAGFTAAKGDGSTNDTAALNALINYAFTYEGYLFFPAGTYLVSGLVMKDSVSLVGMDRYNTIITNAPTTNRPLISGSLSNCTIGNIMLNANMQGQSQNISCIDATVNNILLSNVILKNGYDSLKINCLGYVQINALVVDGVQNNGMVLTGNGIVEADNVVFTGVSPLNGKALIDIAGDNKHISNFLCNDLCTNGVVVNGNNNSISGVVTAATTPVTNTGNNKINIFTGKTEYNVTGEIETTAVSDRETYTGNKTVSSLNSTETVQGDKTLSTADLTETITGNKTVAVGEDLTESITGNSTKTVLGNDSETITGNKTIKADMVYLDVEKPLKYASTKVLNSYFDYVEMQDVNGNPYKVLVQNDGTTSLSNARAQNITARRVGRILTPDNNSTADGGATLNYSYAQGSIVLEDKGKILIAFIPFNSADFQLTNNVMLREYNINDGTLIREKEVIGAGHANGIGYNPNTDTVYIVQCFMWTSKGVNKSSKYILELDYTTLSIQKTYEIQTDFVNGLTFVSFDTATNKLWTGTSYYIFEIDPITHAVLQTVPIKYPPSLAKGFTTQSAYIHNDIMYAVISNPEMLIMHDTSGNYIAMYNMPYWCGGIYAWAENESLTMLSDGTLYITTCGESGPGSENEIIQIFAVNPEQTQAYYQPYYGNFNFYSQLYVDSNATGFNPDGTQANPFKIAEEAMMVLHSPEYWKQNIIVNFTKGTYGPLRAYDITNVEFQGNGSTFSIAYFSRCTNIYFNNAIIDKKNFNLNEALGAHRSADIKFNSIYFKASDTLDAIPNQIVLFELSSIWWTGGLNPSDPTLVNIETYTANTIFYLNNCSLVNEYRLRNMKFSFNKLIPTSYVISGNAVSPGETQPFNPVIAAGKVSISTLRSNFRFINFYIETQTGRSEKFTQYLVNSANATYFIRYMNLPDNPVLGNNVAQLHEMSITITDTGITNNFDNLINLVGAEGTGAVTAKIATGTTRVMFVELSDN